MLRKILVSGFYLYVIALAGYLTYEAVTKKRLGRYHASFTKPSQQCQPGGEGWNYCIFNGPKTDKTALLYVLHGRSQDENFWIDPGSYAALLQNYWESQGALTPQVVTVSFGPAWVLAPQMSGKGTGLLEVFQNQVLATVEKQLGSPKKRFLMGASMGGMNALSLVVQSPDLFNRVAALCPTIYSLSPFADSRKILTHVFRSGARLKPMMTVLGFGRYFFKDESEWLQFSPLELIQKKSFTRLPYLYLTAGMKDEYGNFDSVHTFSQFATLKGANVRWHPTSGDHCAVDIPSLARFLQLTEVR